jgi:predicted nucleic-acid-binding protein
MLAIDTNVLVRLVVDDDPRQTQMAKESTAHGAWVSHLVLAESMWVLAGNFGLSRGDIVNTIKTLLTHPNVAFEDANVVRAALNHFSQRRNVDFSDCLILEIARKAGHKPLATFDRDLAKVDGVQRIDAKA